jgi:hypothetical protein
MMPAALWMSVQAPECECATGEHRFFCPHMLFGATKSAATASTQHSCCHESAAESCCNGDVPTGPGVQKSSSSAPCSDCQAVPSATATASDRVEAPAVEHTAWLALSPAVDQASLTLVLASDRFLPASDRLPMTDRVIVFCCLLI